MRSGAWLVAIGMLASCATDVTVDIADSNHDLGIDGDDFANVPTTIRSVSIEILATNERCRLQHHCISNSTPISLADLRDQMRLAASNKSHDALIEAPADDAQTLVINGRPQESCFPNKVDPTLNDPIFCGYTDLANIEEGTIVVELDPDDGVGAAGTRCPESIELCD